MRVSYVRQVQAVMQKELRSEWRSKEHLTPMFVFAFLVIVIFAFAFPPARAIISQVLPGLIWMALLFASQLCLNRIFTVEKVNDCLTGLLLTPADRTVIYFGKLGAVLLFIAIIEIITLPLFFILFDYHLSGSRPFFCLSLVLGTIGLAVVGTFLAALTSSVKSSELLLPLLLFPVLVPVILGAVKTTALALSGSLSGELFAWFKLLAVYDALFLVLAFLLFDYVLEV